MMRPPSGMPGGVTSHHASVTASDAPACINQSERAERFDCNSAYDDVTSR